MSKAYDSFISSMNADYEKWRDGEGFDLDALKQIAGGERDRLEKKLAERADRDWRYLEALDCLNTPAARRAISKVAHSAGEHALYAAKLLAARKPDAPKDLIIQELLRRIRAIAAAAPVAEVIDTAAEHPTDAVKAALLDATRFSTNPTFRCHAAALLFYFAGLAAEPFDWAYRPFFLKFTSQIPREVGEAHAELRKRLGR